MYKVFIDGNQGTTGLRLFDRLKKRSDIELLTISEDLRKDKDERRKLINTSDITFLCLPDEASRESVSLCDNAKTVIIDTSTAHRTNPDWAYGFAELSDEHRQKIASSKRIAVPGCHASGFISIVYPLIANGIMPADYPVVCHSLTGYSGGGKKMINDYENEKTSDLFAPRQYGLSQNHKHLKEMKVITGLTDFPILLPLLMTITAEWQQLFPFSQNSLIGQASKLYILYLQLTIKTQSLLKFFRCMAAKLPFQ